MFGNKGEGANSRVDRGAEVAEDPGNSSLLRRILMGTFSQRLGLKENQTQSQDEIEFVPVKCSVTAKKEFLAEDCGNLVPTYDVKPCPVKSEVSFCESVKDSVVHDRKSKCDLLEDTKDDISLTLNCDETLKIDKEEFCGELLDETEVENCDIIETEDNCVGAGITEVATEASPLVPSSISRIYEVRNSKKSVSVLWAERQHSDSSADPLFIEKDILQQSSTNPYVCLLCNNRFTHKSKLINHKDCHTDVNSSDLYSGVAGTRKHLCKEDSSNHSVVPTQGTSHFSIPNTNTSYVCSKNNDVLISDLYQAKHVRKKFSCSICKSSLTSRESHTRHMNAHYGIKPFICAFCNKSFRIKLSLRYHIYTHLGIKVFKCSVCDENFSSMYVLRTHQKKHLDLKSRCTFCNREYTLKKLEKHMNTHERHYLCGTCGKSFTYKHNLAKHVKIHSVHRPHTCTICNKSCKLLLQLKRHTRVCHEVQQTTHVKVKKTHLCFLCKGKFAKRSYLREHIKKIHAKEKPHICKICSKTFGYKDTFLLHMKRHSGIKSYVCEICNKSFFCSGILSTHLRNIHKTKPYKCSHCDESFYISRTLKKHMKCHW